ncbi:MAG: hypothetical protein J7455_05975 [Roseiflexus sp.]|nr:hypothetical protein [Roseiflexus sp.]MBO9365432.1 hypothetical protein [Roseiflexus sp.]MBO9383316.1 hypothetical protein [Roseiflexus sp.]MBO9389469.1 hypothetical protein [Roseiflexus sp.]
MQCESPARRQGVGLNLLDTLNTLLQSPLRAPRGDRHARRSVREDIRHRPSSGVTPLVRANDL